MSQNEKKTSGDSSLPVWDLAHLVAHLQAAVDLEFWTIPFYMSAMYSVKNPDTEAYRLIKSVVNQEMLHVQLAGNVYNAYPFKDPKTGKVLPLKFNAPVYKGKKIPHLLFALDTPNPTETYSPYSAEIGPLDEERINTMCLVEYPEWKTGHTPRLQEDIQQYGSIGEFYEAVELGAGELAGHLIGGLNQVNVFKNFYNNFDEPTITRDKADGFKQAENLIRAILSQGEGQTKGDVDIPVKYRNTADGYRPSWPHFRKFSAIRESRKLPETYTGDTDPPPGSPGHQARQTLIKNFTIFRSTLEKLFNGGDPADFGARMATVGGDILTCWQNNAVPRFSS